MGTVQEKNYGWYKEKRKEVRENKDLKRVKGIISAAVRDKQTISWAVGQLKASHTKEQVNKVEEAYSEDFNSDDEERHKKLIKRLKEENIIGEENE